MVLTMRFTWKRAITIIVLMVAVLAIAISGNAMADNAKNPLAIDMVIGIDNSYDNLFNRKLDDKGLRYDAAAALISMCDSQYSRATYFLFSKYLYLYSESNTGPFKKVNPDEIALFDISLPVHKPQRLNLMNNLNGTLIRREVSEQHDVDIGLALSAAVDVEIRNLNNGNRKIILLLSGGNTKDSANIEKAREAKKLAEENGIEIYTVALKDNAAARGLQELATRPENYQFVSNVEDLVDVYRNFFADMIGSKPREIRSTKMSDGTSTINLTIPNDSVAEVNLIIPLKQVNDLVLLDPDGNEIKKTDNSVLVSESRNFITYKLIDPRPETYILKYSSVNEQEIVVQYVFSYAVQVEPTVNASNQSKHKPVVITAKYTEDGLPTKDAMLYRIPATVTLTKDGKQIAVKNMDVDEKENCYTLTFDNLQQYGAGDYLARIQFNGDGLLRESETTFTLYNDAPVLKNIGKKGDTYKVTINRPKEDDSYNVKSHAKEWDLNDYVEDINGDKLTATIISSPDTIEAFCDGMTLSVMPKANTASDGEIRVVVTDSDGDKSDELIFPVTVINYEDRYDTYTARFDPVSGLDKKSTKEFTLRLYDANGNLVKNDDQLPETVEAIVKSSEGQQNILMTLSGDAWIGSFVTGDVADEYSFSGKIKIGQKTIDIQPYTASSNNAQPILASGKNNHQNWNIVINDPQDQSSYQVKEMSWDLEDLVTDPNGDPLTFKIETNPENVSATISDNKLIVKSKLNTSANETIKVTCEDTEHQAGPELIFDVSVLVADEKYNTYSAELTNNNKKKNSDVMITLSVYKTGTEGGRVLDTDDMNLPNAITATVTEGRNEFPLQLTRGENGKWTGTFKTTNHIADYTVAAQIEVSRDQKIVPENCEFTTTNTDPKIVKKLEESVPKTFNVDPFLLWKDETQPVEIDLNDYFTDADEDELKYSISDTSAALLQGSKLTVSGNGVKDSATFTITAKDNDNSEITTEPITYTIHSLKTEGLITIAIVVAAIILLLIFIHAIKPKYPYARFEVSVDSVPFGEGHELPKGKMAKKKTKLKAYAPTLASKEYGQAIHQALGYVILKPSYGKSVMVDASKADGINVKINGKDGRKGKLSNNGKIMISKENKTVLFTLKVLTPNSGTVKKATSEPVRSTQTARRAPTSHT